MKGELLRNAKSEAQTAMQRSEMFWEAFEKSAHRIRYSIVLEAHYRCLHGMELRSLRPRPQLLARLQVLMDSSHDLRLCEEENMCNLAEQARGAEMMGRIWHEEGQDMPEEDFIPIPPTGDW